MISVNPSLFFGTKLILAVALTRAAYNEYRGWTLPADEDGSDEGYLVEYCDGGPSNDLRHPGYISWSPKAVFEGHYQNVMTGMSFGHAIEAMKRGYRVARTGWNGKDMWIALSGTPGTVTRVAADSFWSKHGKNFAMSQGGWGDVLPTVIMKTATDEILMGWLASQTDMLAEDWVVLPEAEMNQGEPK